MSDVTNEKTDPWTAVQSVQYLRERYNEPRGLIYTIVNLYRWREDAQQWAEGNKWLNQAEQYWKARQEAEIQAKLPVQGSAAPVPY